MLTIKDGGPAFPVESATWQGCGMTLRDYFAAKAMQSFLVGSVLPPGFDYAEQMARMAAIAYDAADCMLAAREVQP